MNNDIKKIRHMGFNSCLKSNKCITNCLINNGRYIPELNFELIEGIKLIDRITKEKGLDLKIYCKSFSN